MPNLDEWIVSSRLGAVETDIHLYTQTRRSHSRKHIFPIHRVWKANTSELQHRIFHSQNTTLLHYGVPRSVNLSNHEIIFLAFKVLAVWESNKKTWIELRIAYFPLKRHGPHRKRLVQQFFYCAYIRCSGNVFAEPLHSKDRKTLLDTQSDLKSL